MLGSLKMNVKYVINRAQKKCLFFIKILMLEFLWLYEKSTFRYFRLQNIKYASGVKTCDI